MCFGNGKGAYRINRCLILWLATGSYIGYSPVAPGTCGAILGMVLFLLLAQLSTALYCLVVAAVILIGVWSANKAEHLLGRKDAAPIVIDEIAGMLLTYVAVPVSPLPLLWGFLCFRVFDILKPFPRVEQLPGGWGIMCDDLLAGLLAHACIRLLMALM